MTDRIGDRALLHRDCPGIEDLGETECRDVVLTEDVSSDVIGGW